MTLTVRLSGQTIITMIVIASMIWLCQHLLVEPTNRRHAEGYARNYARRFRNISSPQVSCSGRSYGGSVFCFIGGGLSAAETIRCPANLLIETDRLCRPLSEQQE